MKDMFNHPRPFYVLASIEMWERFGYYGMQALLVLFMVKEMGFSDDLADNTFSAFAALVYAFICLGGWLGDSMLGAKRTMIVGAVFLAAGYGLLSIDCEQYMFLALGIIIAGNALFKANPSSLVSKLYDTDDPRLDGAFTLYYMAVNIGSFLAMLLCPLLARLLGWGVAFGLCFAGMLVALVVYFVFRATLRDIDSEPGFQPPSPKSLALVLIIPVVIAAVSCILLTHLTAAHLVLYLAGLVVTLFFANEMYKADSNEKVRLVICFILIVEAVIFFVLYQQMPTSLNLFAMRNVDLQIFGFISMEPASFQALNPMWVMLCSPILAVVYTRLGERDMDFSMPAKFALGMVLCATSFLVLGLAATYEADSQGMISGNWLVGSYLLQSLGELFISGLGLAMVSKLAPQRSMGFMMGLWFMSQSLAMILGGNVATVASVPEGLTDAVKTLPIYTKLFWEIGGATLAVAVIMIAAAPRLTRIMNKALRE